VRTLIPITDRARTRSYDSCVHADLVYDLGPLDAGTSVRVTLWGADADVMLVTPADLMRFQRLEPFSFVGGHYQCAAVRLVVPADGQWFALVVPSPSGTVEASVRVSAAA
jgi:hypothetical protein